MGSYDSSPKELEVDLTIIGGGPTGLLSAVLARQLGLSVYIIDAKDGPLKVGRADALNARTQQYLEVTGILNHLLLGGLKCNTSSTFKEGKFASQQSHWWTSLPNTHHKNFLMIGQSVVESALLSQLDIPVDYETQATSVTESSSGTVVQTTRGLTIKSKYTIAADGAHSSVRTSLGIPFTGSKPEMIWAVLDTFIETDFPICPEIITFQKHGQSRVSWIPRERGMSRFYVLLDGEITQEKAEASIREHMAPHKVEFKRTEWFSTFEIRERVAQHFISQSGEGRIFLAGDAAHVHSVNGGQGLNTGVADAFGLVWRLAFALKQKGGQNVLNSYDVERRTVAEGVIDVAAKLVRSTVRTAQEYVEIIEKNAGYITGMGVSYPPSGKLVEESSYGEFEAGKRCPDLSLSPIHDKKIPLYFEFNSEADKTRLYSLIKYGKFLVLLLSGNCDEHLSIHKAAEYQSIARFWHIHPQNGAECRSQAVRKIRNCFVADWAKKDEQTAVVIRPDCYTGYVGGDWEGYLRSVFSIV